MNLNFERGRLRFSFSINPMIITIIYFSVTPLLK
jgi:hypothetical protein